MVFLFNSFGMFDDAGEENLAFHGTLDSFCLEWIYLYYYCEKICDALKKLWCLANTWSFEAYKITYMNNLGELMLLVQNICNDHYIAFSTDMHLNSLTEYRCSSDDMMVWYPVPQSRTLAEQCNLDSSSRIPTGRWYWMPTTKQGEDRFVPCILA